ncbi:MAG: tRNA threonylcarbamoyladenosine biosynthesis protein TsaB [Acidimicrobiaceae bacterium]|jgi:tRNA threonylcarbamoyladenosine biosynthesis protein TsaB|nr:tRNA threonylcarbamoyladenosine biosynthesis protein TsaB [Acidimicrobiaceae bacterium]MDQ1364154.1 tRNA threonylcarbamoyladenosine biosynthesis protein TsaB [Acidimicrobiaceae bacterium]MDQ1368119.1 tRNA threonylcarbamoyladenosine biosynthesis protein TsaB [Acidimicrobiaceae bacterium]MDQ1400408.1 tRNA threonylcarbamoyladenosine biosynthesis protein TsaB [Acidimicrobiaceae bacterium]MDQ1442844.1 tRNA threonylcarbamoyladenosine biosynthesis protein TsaB [Acidimicrobiaceae bacterium]
MIILGLDTATSQVGCALGDHEGPVASFQLTRGRRHAETLAPAIDNLCHQAGISLDDVGAVAVDVGPGLFTGLRVGVATGKALAMALRIPMIGQTSLDLLAYPHRRGQGLIASVVDARRGEVFWALYRPVPGGVQRITDYAASPPADLAAELLATGEDTLAVGDGACRYRQVLAAVDRVEVAEWSSAYPSAAVLVELAHPLALREEFVLPGELAPLYLRNADVRINWVERSGLGGGHSVREAG